MSYESYLLFVIQSQTEQQQRKACNFRYESSLLTLDACRPCSPLVEEGGSPCPHGAPLGLQGVPLRARGSPCPGVPLTRGVHSSRGRWLPWVPAVLLAGPLRWTFCPVCRIILSFRKKGTICRVAAHTTITALTFRETS